MFEAVRHVSAMPGEVPPTKIHGSAHYPTQNAYGYPRYSAPDQEVNFRNILSAVMRHIWLIIAVCVLLTGAAAVVIMRLPVVYAAQAVVLVKEKQPDFLGEQTGQATGWSDLDAIQTEVQILSSSSLSQDVIAKLDLKSNPEFNPFLNTEKKTISDETEAGATNKDALTASDAAADDVAVRAALTSAFQQRLQVAPVGRSRAIKISFRAGSPEIPASVVNTLAELYIQKQIDGQKEAYQAAIDWFTVRVADAQARRHDTQLKLSEALSKALSTEEAASLSEVLSSLLIQSLRQQQSVLEQRVAALGARYGQSYPELRAAKSELASVNAAIKDETARILEKMILDAGSSEADMDRTTAVLKKINGGGELDGLAHEAVAENRIYENLLTRQKELEVRSGLYGSVAEIISPATVRTDPVFPNRKLLLMLSLVVAAGCSITLALIIDKWRTGITSGEQLVTSFGSDAAIYTPAMKFGGSMSARTHIELLKRGETLFSESFRTLHTKMLLMSPKQPKTVMVTSSIPGEGKSSLTMGFAILLASTHRHTIVVDCDLRKPRLHTFFNEPVSPGLTEYLNGDVSLEAVIRHNELTGAYLITAGKPTAHPADLLSSPRMKDLLALLSERFDITLLDTAPVRAVSDALVLTPQVDKTIFVVKWRTTSQASATHAYHQLERAGAKIAGVVMTMVNVDKMRRSKLDDYYDHGMLDYLKKR